VTSTCAVQVEGDLEALLSEFAEIVAHKALIDGHIAVLQGETPLTALSVTTSDSNLLQNVAVIQQTEHLIVGQDAASEFFPPAMNCLEVPFLFFSFFFTSSTTMTSRPTSADRGPFFCSF